MARSQVQPGLICWSKWGWTRWLGLLVVAAIVTVVLQISPGLAWESHYAVTSRAPFNQLSYYPVKQTLPTELYRPVGNWVGRLILPSVQEQQGKDWVWLEVYHAPPEAADLIGKRVKLTWSQKPEVQRYVAAVTRDVQFTPDVEALQRTTGNLYPQRLNGRSQVGPLQAIAGARPNDDVTVTLAQATLTQQTNQAELQIATEPLLETGRYYTLVKLLGTVKPTKPQFIPKACPGGRPCPSELFRVQHYNPATGNFDGKQETVRIPQQPIDGFGVYASTPRDLEKSPAGTAGWYLYGAQDKTGLFTVQAIKPRSLFQLQPNQVILGAGKGLDYINYDNWSNTEQQQGKIHTVVIDKTAPTTEAAIANWKAGDRALVMHLFGGRGGQNGEPAAMGTVTGHFSYGIATVIRDPFTNELQFDLHYQQVYATNIEGVISGTNTWTNYMGNLQRGWLGTRPVTDVIVKLDEIDKDYDFGGTRLSPLAEFSRQLSIINARYRTGDGTGAANVTPATSCVQDSNQALFLTIQRIRESVAANPAIQSWWASHPDDPMIQRFERLIALGDDLAAQLMPFGIVRGDWESNANALSGTQIQPENFTRTDSNLPENTLAAVTSWRTILPRQAQDELSILFLRHGATLWFLQTNQVGGHNPDILPIAPTQAFARWMIPGTDVPIVSVLFTRILGALKLPNLRDWSIALSTLLGYGVLATAIGVSQGLLQIKPWSASRKHYLLLAGRLFFLPALLEEWLFRVLLLPYPRAGVTGQMWITWAIVSLTVFVAYHAIVAKTIAKHRASTLLHPIFLTLTGLLGVACTLAYWLTGSLLLITLIHWAVVVVWLTLLGGMEKLPRLRRSFS
ncbi:CPBP family glutamic-type intramembrane protease [Pantanalinema sp. GBBB05]|uniref:CPBP family glutamic-type intramembrane protease n=1 Tax=Pantanalinema sp. GBBB05 TaxID=2604139 RepID=UPI001D6AAFF5|nr:CPBP family intramembrane metalloprotease [Pantanalinema sp. GBBB05]